MDTKKIYSIDFTPMWAVPSGLIILADSPEQALEIARETVKHTSDITIKEVFDLDTTRVIFYESGDY